MRRKISALITFSMISVLSLNVSAVPTNVVDPDTEKPRLSATYALKNGNNSGITEFYYYDTETDVITKSTSAEETGYGHMIKTNQVNDDYSFTALVGDTEYHYQLLDETVVDGKKQYYIYCNDFYGKFSETDATTNVFDIEDETSVAYWLNNSFFAGEASEIGRLTIDPEIKSYIIPHTYLIEGSKISNDEPYKYTYYDYEQTMDVTLLSVHDYGKYCDNIGYGAYNNGELVDGNFYSFMRSPATFKSAESTGLNFLYYFSAKNGNLATATFKHTGDYYIRPAFYISEDYFKNVKLSQIGDEVKKIIRKNNPKDRLLGLYTADELISILGYKQDGAEIEYANVYGFATVGDMLGIDYIIKNGDENTKTEVTWYLSDNSESIGTEIHKGENLVLEDSMLGGYINAKFYVYDGDKGDCFTDKLISVGKVGAMNKIAASVKSELALSSGKKQAEFKILNNSGDYTKKVKLFVVAFDENNIMTGIASTGATLDKQTNEFSLEINASVDADYYRLMVWDNDDNSVLCGIKVREEL